MSGSEPEQEPEKPTSLGIYDRPAHRSVTEIEIAAVVVWKVFDTAEA